MTGKDTAHCKWDWNICHYSDCEMKKKCAKAGMEWEQLGGRKDGKSRECNLRWDGKRSGREQSAVRRVGVRREQKPTLGRCRDVAVRNEMQSAFPFPSRPVADPTTFSRRDHYRAYP